MVHRLVAYAFLGSPSEEAWQVHHQDGDPSNNKVDNLEYVTQSQNIHHSFGMNPSRGNAGHATSKPVMWRPKGSKLWTTFPSITFAATQLGMCSRTLSRQCQQGSPMTRETENELRFVESLEPPLLPGEEWAPMLSPATGMQVEGRQISSCGRIMSSRGVVTHGHHPRFGYFATEFREDSRRVYVHVHKLVAYAFLGPPPSPEHTQINHKDYNKGNNCVDNLEYVTPSENMIHSYKRKRLTSAGALSKPVLGRVVGSEVAWTWYPSMRGAARSLGINPGSVWACIHGTQKNAGVYQFCLAPACRAPELLPGEEWRAVDLQGLLEEKQRRLRRL